LEVDSLRESPGDPSVTCPYCQNSIVLPAELRTASGEVQESALAFFPADFGASLPLDLTRLAESMRAIKELTAQGKKIEAIKVFRETFNVGLAEAREAVEKLERGESVAITSLHMAGSLAAGSLAASETDDAWEQVQSLLARNQKIEAIKLVRERYGIGLKEAKDAVEAVEAGGFSAAQVTVQAYQAGSDRPAMVVSAGPAPQAALPDSTAVRRTAAGGLACGGVLTALIVLATFAIPLLAVLAALASRGGPLHGAWLRVNPLAYARLSQSFGQEGIGAGFLNDPRTVAIDAQGNIYVGSFDDGRVQKFDPAGNLLIQISLGQDQIINGLAVSRDGTMYVSADGQVSAYDSSGGLLGLLFSDANDGGYPDDLVLLPDGRLLIAINSEDLALLDSAGNRSLFLEDAVSRVTQDSELDLRLSVDGLGNLYLLGTFNEAVFKFSPDGRYQNRFGGEGDQDGQFRAPGAVAVDGQGRVYVSDIKGIQVFDPDGRYLARIEAPGYVFDMAISESNTLIAVSNQPAVLIYQLPNP
jgi:ribosomal protein L7/L12/sugar lactone lactonase YvrE